MQAFIFDSSKVVSDAAVAQVLGVTMVAYPKARRLGLLGRCLVWCRYFSKAAFRIVYLCNARDNGVKGRPAVIRPVGTRVIFSDGWVAVSSHKNSAGKMQGQDSVHTSAVCGEKIFESPLCPVSRKPFRISTSANGV